MLEFLKNLFKRKDVCRHDIPTTANVPLKQAIGRSKRLNKHGIASNQYKGTSYDETSDYSDSGDGGD